MARAPRARHRDALSLRRAALLGVVQGAAELAPVSSSAHVALLAGGLSRHRTVEVALHGGTALVLPWVVRDVPARMPRGARGAAVVGASLVPPILAGAGGGSVLDRWSGRRGAVAAGLVAGSAALVWADHAGTGTRTAADATLADGLALGAAQAVALLPGVSRRGATLAAARARGFTREAAGDLSWAAGVPVLAAAAARGAWLSARRGELRAGLPAFTTGAVTAATTLAALSPARGAIERVPYAAWAGWRVAVAAAILDPRGARPDARVRWVA